MFTIPYIGFYIIAFLLASAGCLGIHRLGYNKGLHTGRNESQAEINKLFGTIKKEKEKRGKTIKWANSKFREMLEEIKSLNLICEEKDRMNDKLKAEKDEILKVLHKPEEKIIELGSMDIYAKEGHKVIFSNPDNGHESDRELCKKFLSFYGIYTIDHTCVDKYSTEVYLKEFPGIAFNSVMFSDFNIKENEAVNG
jgi:hypothetical protein